MASPCTSCPCVFNACSQRSSRPITELQQGMQPSRRLSPIANSCRHHSHQLFTGALAPCLPLGPMTKARSVRSKSHCWEPKKMKQGIIERMSRDSLSLYRKCYCAVSQQDHTGWNRVGYNNGTLSYESWWDGSYFIDNSAIIVPLSIPEQLSVWKKFYTGFPCQHTLSLSLNTE